MDPKIAEQRLKLTKKRDEFFVKLKAHMDIVKIIDGNKSENPEVKTAIEDIKNELAKNLINTMITND